MHDDVDTQIDVSPYVSREEQGKTPRHGRDFIGYKTSAWGWTEDANAKRIDLSIVSSSNQLFADYQPHNGNVFSICDNFSYKVGEETRYLESCDASYLIYGWHSDGQKDPFYVPPTENTTLPELFHRNHIHLIEDESFTLKTLSATASSGSLSGEGITEPSDTSNGSGTLLWGAIHNVKWSVKNKPLVTPANEAAALFKNPCQLPIAVGTGPLDALITYVWNHQGEEAANLILRIQTLLIEQEDGVPEQDAAEDLLRNTDYDRLGGGMRWHFSGKEENTGSTKDKEVIPPEDALTALRDVNAIQAKLDTLRRTLPTLQWELFSHWWKFLCDRGKDRNLDPTKVDVSNLSARLDKLLAKEGPQSVYHALPQLIEKTLNEQVKLPCEPAASSRFHQHQDPTLLIYGLESGWPKDHTEETKAHLGAQLKAEHFYAPPVTLSGGDSGSNGLQSRRKLMEELIKVIPNKPEAANFMNAFLNFSDTGENTEEQPVWTKQPWSPLFLEWEVEYYHIPYEHWSMDHYQANSSSTMEHIRWGIKPNTNISTIGGVRDNMRKVDGRVLLLPQPGFSFVSKVKQLFTNIPVEILNERISEKERTELLKHLENSFPYMSCPLSGFTDHLLTLQQGTHINPNQRIPGSDKIEPTEGAIELTKDKIGLGKGQLLQVGDETGATPYAIQVSDLPKTNGAFKPVTHGQFRFTKINIIDKFGQAISVIDQSPGHHPPPMYPWVSELYSVQYLNGKPNTVITDNNTDDSRSEFLQIPPRINQPTKLNAHFMVNDSTDGCWRPADDWENPIFGWLLINFADYGLQVFLPGGQFYREIRLGGASGATALQPWLPFHPPNPPPKVNPELDMFLEKMQDDRIYLEGVYQMILDASKDIEEPPASYAEFLSALVGKPVALSNVGFSLELDAAAKKDHVVYPSKEPPPAEKSVLTYDLPLKIGDKRRLYDGLIGYFEPGHPEKIYTYHVPSPGPSVDGPTTPIDHTTYPTLSPFFIDPNDAPPKDYIKMRNKNLHRVVALLDPFVALHGYTGLLPIVDIKLPHWAVENAMKKMTAFLHLGPVITTKNVPDFDVNHKLETSYTGDVKPYPGKGLAIPAGLKKEDWIWLQPYATGDNQDVLEFMALNVDTADEKVRWEPAPYTAVEGYLQLKRALGGKPPSDDDPKKQPGGESGESFEDSQGWTGAGTGWIR